MDITGLIKAGMTRTERIRWAMANATTLRARCPACGFAALCVRRDGEWVAVESCDCHPPPEAAS